MRGLLAVLLGDRVKIQKCAKLIPVADEIDICIYSSDPEDAQISESIIRGLKLVSPGQSVTTSTFELRISHIASTTDSSVYVISPSTTKITVNALPSNSTVTSYSPTAHSLFGYSRLGGLSSEIALIKKTVELPLIRPQIFERFKISPPRGLLLHGPPGTGKSTILRAIANETPATHVLSVSASTVLGKYMGDTEAALARIFDEAKLYAPSIVLIDELDSLAPKREAESSTEAEARVVSTLAELFDSLARPSLESAGTARVMVVAATNRLNNVDSALRRPGRFDREIEIRIPDVSARQEILALQLQGVPHDLTNAQILGIASNTHGFVGADIVALVREAVMSAVTRGDHNGTEVENLTLDQSDFHSAMQTVRASAMREIFLETPKVSWDDIGGQQHIKQKLRETVEWPLTHPEAFSRLGITAPRGVLLYGPPGCSKTLTAKALASEAGLNFLAVKGPEVFNKYVGESERAIREIFRKARNASPSIVFIDEIDAISAARGHSEVGGDRVLTSILTELDGVETNMSNVIIVAATNRPEIIDPALLRPGRIDRLLYVGPPDFDARVQILSVRFQNMSVDTDVDVVDLATRTDGCSGAEITALCQEAGLQAMNEDLGSHKICRRHFESALQGLNRSITKEMVDFYESFQAGIKRK
ncbi:P-loop containing nucleoside triphosphate hydrolase protein [Lipomyces oligophaga]|uniref:P-loop containing nucleoside triphosphate hydrolase protein n=1 Tax=Lipomyces oligophaga TaxID=45792 RepID=UPI0034CD2680